jgi:hypothetical protein
MVQRSGCADFLLEPGQSLRISGEGRWQDFDGDIAS